MRLSRWSGAALVLSFSLIATAQLRAQSANVTYTDTQVDPTAYVVGSDRADILTLTLATGAATQSGVISSTGLGSVVKDGAGNLLLSAANTFAGSTTVSAGTLTLGNALALQNTSLDTTGAGAYSFGNLTAATVGGLIGSGSLSLTNDSAQAVSLTINSNLNASTNFTYSGVLSGSGSVIKTNNGAGAFVIFTGNNTYTGGTTITAGGIFVDTASGLGSGTINLNGGRLGANTGSVTLANNLTLNADSKLGSNTTSLTLSGNFVLAATRELNVIGTTGVTTISGVISETGGPRVFIKTGTGELDLIGANTYTGGTLISAGTVKINNSSGSAFGTGAVTVASGATLTGAGTFTGALQVNGTYSPGNSPALVSEPGDITIGSTGLLEMQIGGLVRGTDYDALAVGGTFTTGGTLSVSLLNSFTPGAGATFDLFDWGTLHGTFATLDLPALSDGLVWDTSALYTTGSLSVSAIPEPATYAVIFGGLALAGVMLVRRPRQKA